MSDTTDNTKRAQEPITVTLELPSRIVLFYDMLTEAGLYLSTHEALRSAILNSWRFEKGSYHSLRVDADSGNGKVADETEKGQDPIPTAEA